MAMVGVVAASVCEYFGRDFRHITGVSAVPITRPDERRGSRQHGWSGQYRKCFRPDVLGVGIRFDHQTRDIRGDVSGTDRTLLVSSYHQLAGGALTIVAFIVLMCYGGGFGIMPAFAADYFGLSKVGAIYGLMLTAGGFASAFGRLLIAYMRQATGSYGEGLHVIAGVMAVSVVVPVIVSPPRRFEEGVSATQPQRQPAA